MRCPECNGERIIDGVLTSRYGVMFTEKGTENRLRPNSYKMECRACEDCGKLFDFRIIFKKKKNKQ